MTTNHLCLFESRDSEAETIPDEDYNNLLGRNKKEVNSWHVGVSNRPKLNEGPNINLKYFKKKYDTEEEKHFITKKIRTKKKTELCKNWEIYHDCYFKNESTLSEEEMKYIYKFIKKKVLKNENQVDYQITIILEVIPGARKSIAYEIDRKKCLDLVPIRVIRPYYKEAKIKSNYEKEKQLKIYLKNKNELLLSEEEFLRAYINIYQTVLKNKHPVDSPIAITLGGQPGSGKSTIYKIARKRFSNNIVEIDVDKLEFFIVIINK